MAASRLQSSLKLRSDFTPDERWHLGSQLVDELLHLRRAALGQFAQCPRERLHHHRISVSENQPTHVERSRGITAPSARSIVQRHRTDHRRTPPPAVWGPSPAPDFSSRTCLTVAVLRGCAAAIPASRSATRPATAAIARSMSELAIVRCGAGRQGVCKLNARFAFADQDSSSRAVPVAPHRRAWPNEVVVRDRDVD